MSTDSHQAPAAESLTPQLIVEHLDQHIIGQQEAKKAMAIALRNRWRRLQVEPELRAEIVPKNILMIGPTGVGKSEISRRLAKLTDAPFIKVEATTFTQVGYVGKDVESIIRELTQKAYKMLKKESMLKSQQQAENMAEERILDIMLPVDSEHSENSKEKLRKKLRTGALDEKLIDLDIAQPVPNLQIMGPPGMDELTDQLQQMLKSIKPSEKTRKVPIKQAKQELIHYFSSELVDEEELREQCIKLVEQKGIVFIDEVDKITHNHSVKGDISREGVQRDLLPLIEGTAIQTKFGTVHTDHILFITCGAFHQSKPSDLIAELQGRLPIRVELVPLTADDFEQILTNTKHSLLKQYSALLAAEGIKLKWQKSAIRLIAEIAHKVNSQTENIGARRLHTLIERMLNDILFDAPDVAETTITIDCQRVSSNLESLANDKDLSHFIL